MELLMQGLLWMRRIVMQYQSDRLAKINRHRVKKGLKPIK